MAQPAFIERFTPEDKCQNSPPKLGMVSHACNPSTWEDLMITYKMWIDMEMVSRGNSWEIQQSHSQFLFFGGTEV
jgi:hypothetical protein